MKKVIRIPCLGEVFRSASVFIALALTMFSFNSALAAPLLIAPFDNPAFTTAQAQGAWQAQGGSTPVYAADAGAWGNEHVMVVPCNMPGQIETRCYHDRVFSSPVGFSNYKEFSLEVFVPDTGAVNSISLMFEAKQPWQAFFNLRKTVTQGWQTLTFSVPEFIQTTQVPSWDQISTIRLSAWECKTSPQTNTPVCSTNTQTQLAIRALRAVAKSPVVLVKDTGGYYNLTSQLLASTYIAHDIVSIADLERDYLTANVKMLILPNNSGLSSAVRTKIEGFVDGVGRIDGGGRIMAHHSLDPWMQALLGVSLGGFMQGASDQFASFRFSDPTAPDLPPLVHQDSWGIYLAEAGNPLSDPTVSASAKVIADWYDYNDTAGAPAWIASNTGLYMSHVLLSDDAATKSKMLLQLIDSYIPQAIGQESSTAAITDYGRVGKYSNYDAAVIGIRANEAQLPATRVTQIEAALTNADTAHSNAVQMQNSGLHVDAITAAQQARSHMQDAYALGQIAGPVSEFRAVWSSAGAGPFPGDWARAVDLLADNGFNAVFPNVASGGVAYYDQLQAAVTAGHAKGVKVHAWDIAWPMSGGASPPASTSCDNAENRLMCSVVTSVVSLK